MSSGINIISPAAYRVMQQASVDGEPWYTVRVLRHVGDWIREQPGQDECWYEHIDRNWYIDRTTFDINEQMFILLKLRW